MLISMLMLNQRHIVLACACRFKIKDRFEKPDSIRYYIRFGAGVTKDLPMCHAAMETGRMNSSSKKNPSGFSKGNCRAKLGESKKKIQRS